MGNCFALCIPNRNSCAGAGVAKHRKVLRVVKTDGKIMEFRAPILVEELLVKFSGLGVGVSKEASQHLPLNYELKIGKIYHLLPSNSSVGSISPAGVTSMADTKQAGGIKRIKVVITKKQLQELLSKQIVSVEEVISGLNKRTSNSSDSSTNWKPKLEPIPEGSE